MTFARGVFIFAIVMLLIGIVGTKMMLDSLFNGPQIPVEAALLNTVTPAPTKTPAPVHHVRATSVPPTSTPLPTLSPIPTTTPPVTPTPIATLPPVSTPGPHAKPTPHPTASPTPTPAPTTVPTMGTVQLARYWVGSTTARAGATIAIGYVIDNETGQTQQLALGVSLKPSQDLSWLGTAIADPSHDVVAVVPPGISTHVRYFTLPAGAAAGRYDVAWGLKDTAGNRLAVISAPAALLVDK